VQQLRNQPEKPGASGRQKSDHNLLTFKKMLAQQQGRCSSSKLLAEPTPSRGLVVKANSSFEKLRDERSESIRKADSFALKRFEPHHSDPSHLFRAAHSTPNGNLDYSKYAAMLTSGFSVDCVRDAMERDHADPSIICLVTLASKGARGQRVIEYDAHIDQCMY
jgi:hypothetical protein